ncbi:MAG: PHP domain-containing protein [Anaerolineaceae bacterium]|jgi:predicted metal-dependent phosphoesterase TrpH
MNEMKIDLHTHTYFSDGRASPVELVNYAARIGVQVLAICDHDNARGVREALPIANHVGMRLIPGVEFTTRWNACEMPPEESDVDLLGYFINPVSQAFLKIEEAALADFTFRMETWCAALTAAGTPLTLQDVYQQNPRYPGTLQLILAVAAKGYGQNFAGAEQIVRSQMNKVPLCSHTIEQAIADIHICGGAAVLAHPGTRYLRWQGGLLSGKGLRQLVELGLDGIEIYHHAVDQTAQGHFLTLAQHFHLAITGGSDEHGWPSGFPFLGNKPVTFAMVEALARKAGVRI